MNRRTEIELERAKMLKAARAAIRLKYALMADEEINDRLPDLEDQFNRAIASGGSFTLDVSSVFEVEA